MADFEHAFQRLMQNEGGFTLSNNPADRGGQTYAGIARRMQPAWPGWAYIDRGETPPTDMVRSFYRAEYWDRVRGDEITSQRVAENLFDFHVNAGGAAIKLAQIVAGAIPDGSIGPKTLAAINAADPALFVSAYALAKIARYRDIVTRDRSQGIFLLGWINRCLACLK